MKGDLDRDLRSLNCVLLALRMDLLAMVAAGVLYLWNRIGCFDISHGFQDIHVSHYWLWVVCSVRWDFGGRVTIVPSEE